MLTFSKSLEYTPHQFTNKMINDKRYNAMSFPRKLHAMLEDAGEQNMEGIVSWQPSGKSFKVLQPKRFADEIMQKYFNQSKYKSFQRQLNIYGFRRIHHGPNMGGYQHKHFVRHSLDECDQVVRRGHRNQSSDSSTVLKEFVDSCFLDTVKNGKDLFSQEQVEPISLIADQSSSFCFQNNNVCCDDELKFHELEVQTFFNFFYPNDPTEKAVISNITMSDDEGSCGDDDVEDALRLLSEGLESETSQESTNDDDELPSEESSFPWKLHLMLEHAEHENHQHIVSWMEDGTAFKVHDSEQFVEKIMVNYFSQTKFESFRRQLNMYGFRRESRGTARGVIRHPSFLRGARHLCKNVKRTKLISWQQSVPSNVIDRNLFWTEINYHSFSGMNEE